MVGATEEKKEGREDEGRGEATRQSRRVQGQAPEEVKDLDQLMRDNRRRKASLRTQKSEAQDQGDPEPEDPDAPGVSFGGEGLDVPHPELEAESARTEQAEGESPKPAEASQEGVVMAESPTGLVGSDPPPTGTGADTSISTLALVEEKSRFQDAQPSSEPQPRPEPVSEPMESTLSQTPARREIGSVQTLSPSQLRAEEDVEMTHANLEEDSEQIYVGDQVKYWELYAPGVVTPHNVAFTWPNPRPDSTPWLEQALATQSFLTSKMQGRARGVTWLRALNPHRWSMGLAEDVAGVQVDLDRFTARECTAVLQTLLFGAGFRFVNLVPEWSETRAAALPEPAVKSLARVVLNHLATELIEWRKLIAGVQHRIVPILEASSTHAKTEEALAPATENTWDEEMAEAMDVEDAETLGFEFATRFAFSGLQARRSKEPSDAETQSSANPSQTALTQASPMSADPSTGASSLVTGIARLGIREGAQKALTPRAYPVPSSVGPTGDSESWPSSRTPGDSSGSSSLMSTGHDAGAHMSYSVPAGRALTARGIAGPDGSDMGGVFTRTVYHDTRPLHAPVHNAPEDPTHAGVTGPGSSPGGERADEQDRPRRDYPESTRGDARSERTHRSRRSTHSGTSRHGSETSRASGPSQIALNLMRQEQEKMEQMRKDAELERQQARESQRQFQEEQQRQMQQFMNNLLASQQPAPVAIQPAAPRGADLEVLLQQEREAMRVAFERNWQERQAQADAERVRVEAERIKAETLERQKLAAQAEQRRLQDQARQRELAEQVRAAEQLVREAQEWASSKPEPAPGVQDVDELLQRERERLAVQFEDQWKKAEMARESRAEAERAQWVEEITQGLSAQMASVQREREAEREAALTLQKFQASQIRDLRATLSQVQGARATPTPDSATGHAQSTHATTSASAQGAHASSVIKTEPAAVGGHALKTEAALKAEPTAPGGAKNSASASKKQTVHSSKKGDKTSGTKKSKKGSDPPSDSDPESESDPSSSSGDDWADENGPSSSDSDSSIDGNTGVVASQTGGDRTVWSYRPFINFNAVEVFNQNASLEDRVGWWERFKDIAMQGVWNEAMRIRQLRNRLPATLRDWFTQLPKRVRTSWRELKRQFRRRYCRARGTYAERYYTMRMKYGETALEFLYRLNAVGIKAGIPFQTKASSRERHIRRFIKKLTDKEVKIALQGQRFKRVKDVEHAIRRHEDVWSEEGYDEEPPRPGHDFRGDNLNRDRYRPKNTKHAFVTQSASSVPDLDEERHVTFSDPPDGDEAPNPDSGSARDPGPSVGEDEFNQMVYRAMENAGWRSPGEQSRLRQDSRLTRQGQTPPRRENPFRDEVCANCQGRGHTTDNCWQDMICDQCGSKGHPARRCWVKPCIVCGLYHRVEACEELKVLKNMGELARQGALEDLPVELRNRLSGIAEADPGETPLNH